MEAQQKGQPGVRAALCWLRGDWCAAENYGK
jgi:hypothetical protein